MLGNVRVTSLAFQAMLSRVRLLVKAPVKVDEPKVQAREYYGKTTTGAVTT